MKYAVKVLLAITFLLFNLRNEKLFAQQQDHVPGDILVMLKKGIDANAFVNDYLQVNGSATEIKADQQLSVRMNIWKFHFNNNLIDENVMLGLISRDQNVLLAQFNHYTELRNTPNDASFGSQWNMLNIGQTGGTTGADMDATLAWDLTTGGLTPGGDTIIVAIDDAGFDLNHTDIHFWKNFKEIPNNSIDDDENGYIDDFDGWNAVTNTGAVPTSDPHGTEVSGVAGAKGNNSIGVTGVNWNVQIMPVGGYSGNEAIVVTGYSYILDMRALYNQNNGTKGAFVVAVNSSFGINNGQPSVYPLWCAMYDSMGKYGIINAAATANSNVNVDVVGDIPTACPSDYLISVTNTTKTDNKYANAGYGLTTIDLGAPGTEILTTYPGSSYFSTTGTSLASPHLAGAVGLLYSLPCLQLKDDYKNDPAATALHIKNFILDGVDPIADLDGKTVTGGRLNIYNALLNEAAYYNCNVGVEDVSVTADHSLLVYPNPVVNFLNVVIKNASSGDSKLSVKNILGQEVLTQNISSHLHVLTLNVADFSKGIYFLTISNGDARSDVSWVKE